jgi:sortase (surface protein transpeptidase)
MAGLVRRALVPLLAGIAVWLISFPLLTSHPAPPSQAVASRSLSAVAADPGDRATVLELLREHRAALAAATAAAVAAPAQSVAVAVQKPPTPPAPAILTVRANTIVIPSLGLSLPVGWYSDCLGQAPVPRWGAWRWSCAGTNNTYIMAHNPGTFTPILRLHVGDVVEYGDSSGRVHTYRVSSTTIVTNTTLWPLASTDAVSLTLQTCWTWDGSRDFIVRAVQI